MTADVARPIPPVDRDDFAGDEGRTLAPFEKPPGLVGAKPGGKPPAGKPGAPLSPVDPFDDPAEARTIPPFDPPKSVKGGPPKKPETLELDPFDDEAEARTLAPFDRPKNVPPPGKKQPVVPASDVFSADAMTLPPTPASALDDLGLDDIPLDAPTLALQHLKGQVPPRGPAAPARPPA